MNSIQAVIIIVLLGLAVQLTRGLPFVLFDKKSTLPPIIDYMGKCLPAAMMGLLIIYCFKEYDFTDARVMVPAVVASACVALLHLWKRNMVLSIGVGTAIYMIMLRIM